MSKMAKHKQQGFTLVELLLALAVFSFVLVFITTAFVQIFRTYNRGITRKEVNQGSRLLLNDMISKMRTVSSPSQVNASQVSRGRLCLGGYSYVWNPVRRPAGWSSDNRVNGQVVNIVRIDNDTAAVACDPTVTNITVGDPTSMFSDRVGVQQLTVTPVGGVSDLYQLSATTSTSQLSLLDALGNCNILSGSTEYCAQSTLTATVGLRNR